MVRYSFQTCDLHDDRGVECDERFMTCFHDTEPTTKFDYRPCHRRRTHTQTGGVVSFSGLGLARYLFPFPLVVYFICRPKSGYPQNLTTSIIGRREAAPAPAVPRDRRPKTFLLLNHTDNVGGKKKKRKLVSFCFPPFLSFRLYHTHTHT